MKSMKWMMMLVTAAGISGQSVAQSTEEIMQRYANESAVLLNYRTELRLFLQNEVPVAERKQVTDLLVLNEKNASLFSRSSVYHSSFNELTSLDAYTLPPDSKRRIPVGEKKTATSVSQSIFYDDVKETSFDFPQLTRGAVAHTEYTQFLKDGHLLTPFSYPASIPGINVAFSVQVPDAMQIRYLVMNDSKGLLQLSTEKKRGQTTYTWRMNHVKNETAWNDAPDDRYYEPHVIVYISSYRNSAGEQRYIQNTDDLYKWNAAFLATLNQTEDPQLRRITDSLIAGKNSQLEKANAIYEWVQKSIRYVAFESGLEGFRPRQAAEVCSKRYGDCKDMSSILTCMMRMAGIKAYYTWIGTRHIPYKYTEVPLPITDNHMIATAEIDGQWYFIDGTSPNSKLHLPPDAIQGKQALISLSPTEYKVLEVPVMPASTNVVIDSTFVRLTDNGVAGHEKVTYKGYFGEDVYNALLYRDEKGLKDYVKTRMGKASNKFMLGDYQIHRTDPANSAAAIEASFEIPDYSKKVGNEYYINLHLEKLFENQRIDTARRKVPKEFDYQYEIVSHHLLEIPDGYQVSYKPEDLEVETPFYKLKIEYKTYKDRIIATQHLTHKVLMLQPEQFADWNKPLAKVQAHYKEQIVLEKK